VQNCAGEWYKGSVMRIDELTLVGFRCFERATFRFSPHFNLVVGENGSGKTSMLEGLAVAIGSWLLGIRGYDSRHLWPEDVRVNPHTSNGDFTFEEVEQTEVWACGEVVGENLRWGRALRGRKGRTTSREANTIRGIAEESAKAVRSGREVTLPLISYYGTGRLWQIPRDLKVELKLKREQLSRFQGYRNSVDPRCSPTDFMRWLKRQEWIAFQEKSEPPICRAVKQAVLGCLDGGKSIGFSAKREQVVVEIEGHGLQPFENLSDGQRNMVAMIGDIAIKAAQLNSHLGERAIAETPGVVLIDELDLHLHPRWQRHIVGDLRRIFPKIQFFCTTHSPQIVGEVGPKEIQLLAGDGAMSVTRSEGMDSNWILRHVMGADERNPELKARLNGIERQIADGDFDEARAAIAKLRDQGWDLPELAVLSTRLDKLEAHAQ